MCYNSPPFPVGLTLGVTLQTVQLMHSLVYSTLERCNFLLEAFPPEYSCNVMFDESCAELLDHYLL